MTRIKLGSICLVLGLGACGGKEAVPKVPVSAFLSPEGVTHLTSRFTPDGSRVSYWTPGSDGWDLVIANADLSNPRTVSSHNVQVWNAAWSPDGKQLAFGGSASGVADVMVVSADSGAPRQLTNAPGFEVPTAWNPRGDRLSYSATGEGSAISANIFDLATGQSTRVANPGTPFVKWSPDGTRLALEGFRGTAAFVWIADSLGAGARQLTTDGQESDLNWSPDGTEIAYVSRRTGTGDIWVVPVNGGAPRQLTHDIREDNNPRWSADGKWIAFISQRGQQTDLWVVPAAGGPEIRITDDAAEEGNPSWIGKSHRLAYHTGISGQSAWAINVTDGKERRLTPDSLRIGEIMPSPDGTELYYEAPRGGGVSDIQVIPMAGGTPRTLVANGSLNLQANWSPDGKSLVYLSNKAGNQDVWIVSAAGGAPRQLTDFPTAEANAQWSPDGQFIYFTSPKDSGPWSDVWKVPAAGGAPVRITHTGTVSALAVSLVSDDILVQSEGGKGGQTTLSRVMPDGTLKRTWEKSPVTSISWFGFTPKGDSMAINAQLPGGGIGSFLISTKTGQGRQMLGKGDQVGDFSRDGHWLAYFSGGATLALGVIDMKDGSHRQLTKSPESEASYWWTADNNTMVFTRLSQRRRIAVVDLTKLLAAAGK